MSSIIKAISDSKDDPGVTQSFTLKVNDKYAKFKSTLTTSKLFLDCEFYKRIELAEYCGDTINVEVDGKTLDKVSWMTSTDKPGKSYSKTLSVAAKDAVYTTFECKSVILCSEAG